MESDSAPKEAVPLTQLQKGTKRHYLNAEHGTFFEALASFFGENSEEIKRVIMDMKDEADAPPQMRAMQRGWCGGSLKWLTSCQSATSRMKNMVPDVP